MPSFEFNIEMCAKSLIDVENIGQFALEASNDDGYCWYIIIRTLLGTVTIATCGPVIPDIDLLPSGFTMRIERMPYKEDKIDKYITGWLNDRSKKLTTATTIEVEDAINQFRDLPTYLRNYSEELN